MFRCDGNDWGCGCDGLTRERSGGKNCGADDPAEKERAGAGLEPGVGETRCRWPDEEKEAVGAEPVKAGCESVRWSATEGPGVEGGSCFGWMGVMPGVGAKGAGVEG